MEINKIISFIIQFIYVGEVICSKCQLSTITTTLNTASLTITIDTTVNLCNDATYMDRFGGCGYFYVYYCGNIALDINGDLCPPFECENQYGPCPCAKGYLEIYGCVCGCDDTTTKSPLTIDSNIEFDYNDICANIALGINGHICSPSECEYIYGPCPCANGYVGNYGCVCDCTTTVLPTTMPLIATST